MGIIINSLYFFLPAFFANMAPVIFKKLPLLEMPIWEKRLGKNKTWRGLIVAPLLGLVVFYLQKLAYLNGFSQWAVIDYADFPIWLGFFMGLGAIIGDAVKSFQKRKNKIKPGQRWLFWDQLDFVIGGLIGSFVYYVPPAGVVLVLFIATPILHIGTNHVAYWLGLRKVKW